MTPKTMSAILNLNDDCFLEIYEYLAIDDLLSLSTVCKRLHFSTQHELSKRFRKVDLSNREQMGQRFRAPYKLRPLRLMFKRFSDVIEELSFSWDDSGELMPSTPILNLISRYCNSLKDLKITGITFKASAWKMEALLELFERLNSLTLNGCFFINTNDREEHAITAFFNHCTSLKSLTVHGAAAPLQNSVYPKLESLTIIGDEMHNDEFLKRHPNLKYLKVRNLAFSALKSCVNLESLHTTVASADITPENMNHLLSLDKLKELRLKSQNSDADHADADLVDFIRALAVKNQIEILQLCLFRLQREYELFDAFLQCNKLKELRIGPTWKWDHAMLERISQNLPNVTKLYLNYIDKVPILRAIRQMITNNLAHVQLTMYRNDTVLLQCFIALNKKPLYYFNLTRRFCFLGRMHQLNLEWLHLSATFHIAMRIFTI